MPSPNIADAMTEHSMCHPGRPGPHGEGHEGSPGLEAFQSAKSELERRPVPIDRAPKHEATMRNDESINDQGRNKAEDGTRVLLSGEFFHFD